MLRWNITRQAIDFLKKSLNLSQDDAEIALYGLQVLLYTTTGFLTISLMGWLWGCLAATLAVMLTTAVLRSFSGGAHSCSPLLCNLIGMIVVPLLGKAAVLWGSLLSRASLWWLVLPGFLITLLVVGRLAPVESPAKPLSSDEERRRFRLWSVQVVLLATALQVMMLFTERPSWSILAISFGLWWQAFTLTAAGRRLAAFLDNCWKGGMTA